MSDNNVAVITGGASGMGEGIAKLLGTEMNVAVWDMNSEGAEATAAAVRDAGGEALARRVDVSDRTDVRAAAGEVLDRWGRADVLVHAAGFADFVDFLDLPEENWDRMIDVHLKGAFNCSQALLGSMRENGFGRIVCISSVGATFGSVAHSHYAAAKAGLIGFAKSLCREIGPWGATINVVSPGAIETPFWEATPADALKRFTTPPVGRIGSPADIAHTVRFLASPEAGYLTGCVIAVNGGAYT